MSDKISDSMLGNVDPRHMDATEGPKRKRRPRARKPVPMPDVLKSAAEEARRAVEKMPRQPGVILERTKGGGVLITAPYEELAEWETMLCASFGGRSVAVRKVFLLHLKDLCREVFDHAWEEWVPSEMQLNAALAIVHGTKPKNEIQAMLAAQMVATHWMQMRASSYGLRDHGRWVDPRNAAVVSMLSRTFTQQAEALDRMQNRRRTVRQVITVKRESHHHEHKHVHFDGGAPENWGQPHGPTDGDLSGIYSIDAGELGGCAALPGPQPSGESLRLPGDAREAGVPKPRRKKPGGAER